MPRRRLPELRIGATLPPRPRTARRGLALLFALLACVIALTTVLGNNGVLHMLQLRRQHEALSERAFLVVGHNKRLRQKIVRLRQDDTYLEAVARDRLGLVRDREVVYRFSAPSPEGGAGSR
jgi:cell division protein FtsB